MRSSSIPTEGSALRSLTTSQQVPQLLCVTTLGPSFLHMNSSRILWYQSQGLQFVSLFVLSVVNTVENGDSERLSPSPRSHRSKMTMAVSPLWAALHWLKELTPWAQHLWNSYGAKQCWACRLEPKEGWYLIAISILLPRTPKGENIMSHVTVHMCPGWGGWWEGLIKGILQ